MKSLIKIILFSSLIYSTNTLAVEVTPLAGFRSGGEFIDTVTDKRHSVGSSNVYGLILGWPYERDKMIEVYYSHQSSDLESVDVEIPTVASTTDIPLTIDYLHFGGTAPITDEDYEKALKEASSPDSTREVK